MLGLKILKYIVMQFQYLVKNVHIHVHIMYLIIKNIVYQILLIVQDNINIMQQHNHHLNVLLLAYIILIHQIITYVLINVLK